MLSISDQFIRDAKIRGDERRAREAAEAAPRSYRRPPQASAAPLAEVLSPSQISTFTDCAARWWFQYGLNLPTITTGKQVLGTSVHEALTYNLAQKIESGHDLSVPEAIENYRLAWEVASADAAFRDDENPAEIFATGQGLVSLYMSQQAPKIHANGVELAVNGVIGGVKVQGRLDCREEDGTIVDIKTSGKSPSGMEPSHLFQLTTYAQLTPRASGKVRVDTLVATKTPKLVQMTRTLEPRDFTVVEKLYPLAQDTMRAGYYMPNRSSMFCSRRNCAFWRTCQAEYGGQVDES